MSLEGKKGILQEMKDVAECMRLANANMLLLLAAAACSALAMLVNLGIVSLLFPLAEGLIKQNFTQLSGGWIGRLLHLVPLVHSDSTSMFCALLTMIYVLVVLKAALDYVLKLVIATQAEAASSQILMKLVDRYLRFGRSYLDSINNEKINTEISRCTAWIVQQISGFHSLLSNFLMLCFYLVLMSIISWRLTLSLAIVVPVIVLSIRYCITRLEGVAKTRTKSADDLKIKTAELIKRVSLVQPSGTIARELTNLSQRAKHQFTVAWGYQRLASLIDPLHEVGTTTAQLILAWMLALVSSSSSLEPSHVFVFFYLSSKVIPLCNLLNQFRTRLATHAGGMEILRSVMSDEDKAIIAAGHRHFTGINDAISFQNLSFSYKPETPVFVSLTFAIKAGSVTALVGETGAGKTTIAHLLLRLYDCNPGQVFLDKTDIRDFTLESIRKMIAFVPQDPIIFDDTLHANLCYELDEQPSETEINDALAIVQLTQFVDKLPEGLESSLGDRGVRLSAGQRQRIALCRALLKNAPILILDEATASLDPRTEELVINALLNSVKGRTTLLISHKLSTVRYADHISVLADHRIVQSGTLSELTREEGPFTRCFNIEKGAPIMA